MRRSARSSSTSRAIPAPLAIDTPAQPIAIDGVVEYLVAAIMSPASDSRIVEIGGADRVTYAELMREYARQRRLRRRMIPTELITPRVSSMALARVPLYGEIAASMATSLRNATVVEERSARDVFAVKPHGIAAAVERALRHEDDHFAGMEWSAASAVSPGVRWGGHTVGRRRVRSRAVAVRGGPGEAFARIQGIGGTTGWYSVRKPPSGGLDQQRVDPFGRDAAHARRGTLVESSSAEASDACTPPLARTAARSAVNSARSA